MSRSFAAPPRLHVATTFLSQGEYLRAIKEYVGLGVDDVWMLPKNILEMETMKCCIHAVLGNRAGVLALPKTASYQVKAIAKWQNMVAFWSEVEDMRTQYDSPLRGKKGRFLNDRFSANACGGKTSRTFTWFADHTSFDREFLPSVACYGSPLSEHVSDIENASKLRGKSRDVKIALCGIITPEVIERIGNAVDYYVVSPWTGNKIGENIPHGPDARRVEALVEALKEVRQT